MQEVFLKPLWRNGKSQEKDLTRQDKGAEKDLTS